MDTLADLGRVLRELRRRHARHRRGGELTYRELAAATGWSHGIIGEYLGGKVLPPTDRFDILIRVLGATPPEQGVLATARDRVEERRRGVVAVTAAAGFAVPRQLPADVFGFTGRLRELSELDKLLDSGERESAVVISAVSGTAGVGKTTLAVRWAHRVANQFPDGQLYLDLRGYDPDQPVAPAAALAGFLRSLGLSSVDIPADVAERAARYRTLLADRRMLVVLDNARTADQVRPLLPGSRTCLVVVTSRDDLAGLVVREGARRIDLDVLTELEAVALLRALGGPRMDAEPDAAAALARRCARLPLALRIAAEMATTHPETPVADLVADLGDDRRGLDPFDGTGDPRTAMRAVFSWSHQNLSAGAARAFGLLGLHPGRHLDGYAVAALTGAEVDRARGLVEELSRAHLIEPVGTGYAMHDLLRAYAVECAGDGGPAALTRLLDHYRFAARLATQTLFPHDQRPDVSTIDSIGPAVDDPAWAQRWLDEQRANLVAVAVHAARHGWPGHAADLSQILWRYLEVGGHYQDALAVHTEAAASAGPASRAAVLANLGGTYWWLGRYADARVHFEQALAGHRAAGDQEGEARALARLGVVHERLGDYVEALDRLTEALRLYRLLGNRHGEGAQLVNVGTLYRRIGRYADAAEHQRQAAAVFVELGDHRLQGYALGNLGAVYSLLGRHPEAVAHLEHALALCRRTADRGGEGSALGTLGAAQARAGRPAEALEYLHRALAISRETADRSLETETLNTLGATLRAMEESEAARSRYEAALTLARQTGDRYEQARAHDGLARSLRDAGRSADACAHGSAAAAIYSALGVPETEPVMTPDSVSRSR